MIEEQINLPTRDIVSIERYMTGDGYRKISKRLGIASSTVRYHLNFSTRQTADCRSAKHRAMRRELRQKLLRRLLRQSKCAVCGCNDPMVLQFDHVDPADKVGDITYMISKGTNMERLRAELRKCRILCANCHTRHTHKQQNSYRWKAFGDGTT